MILLAPEWLWGLLAIPVVGVILSAGMAVRRRALRRFFGNAVGRDRSLRSSPMRSTLRGAMLLIGLALVVLALARPAYDPKPRKFTSAGRDVVFIIDVSRSMLAQDLKPSRLERAKLCVRDVLDVVEGDRVGIIAFAGTASIKCPLTTDYAFARMALDELNPDSILRGGTSIGSALRAAVDLLAPEAEETADKGRYRDVFLFTDGEDTQTDPLAAASEAGKKGIRLITLALGSDVLGAPVPARDPAESGAQAGRAGAEAGYVQYRGSRVESKADPETLRKVAEAGAPGGAFFNVGTANIELDRVYRRLMRESERRKLDDSSATSYTEAFQFLLAGALALLLAEPLLSINVGRRGIAP